MTLRTLNYGNYGIFLIMGNAGFCPSTVRVLMQNEAGGAVRCLSSESPITTKMPKWSLIYGFTPRPLHRPNRSLQQEVSSTSLLDSMLAGSQVCYWGLEEGFTGQLKMFSCRQVQERERERICFADGPR